MSNKFHIGENGPMPCNAQPGKCPINPDGSEHYSTMEEAVDAYESTVEEDTPKTATDGAGIGDGGKEVFTGFAEPEDGSGDSDNSAENQGKVYVSKVDLLNGSSLGQNGYIDTYRKIDALVNSEDLTDEEMNKRFDAIMTERYGKRADRAIYNMNYLLLDDYYHKNKTAFSTEKDSDIDLETLENEVLSDLDMKVVAVSGGADNVIAIDKDGKGYHISRREESDKYNMRSTTFTGYLNGNEKYNIKKGEEIPDRCTTTDVRTMVAMARAKDLIGQSPFLREPGGSKLGESEKTKIGRIDGDRLPAKTMMNNVKTLSKILSAQVEKQRE